MNPLTYCTSNKKLYNKRITTTSDVVVPLILECTRQLLENRRARDDLWKIVLAECVYSSVMILPRCHVPVAPQGSERLHYVWYHVGECETKGRLLMLYEVSSLWLLIHVGSCEAKNEPVQIENHVIVCLFKYFITLVVWERE